MPCVTNAKRAVESINLCKDQFPQSPFTHAPGTLYFHRFTTAQVNRCVTNLAFYAKLQVNSKYMD